MADPWPPGLSINRSAARRRPMRLLRFGLRGSAFARQLDPSPADLGCL